MAQATQTRQINGKTYEVTQLGAVQGSKALARLFRLAGPALAGKDAAGALGGLAANLSDEDMAYFCELFAAKTMIPVDMSNGAKIPLSTVFDSHFQGDYGSLMKWLVFSLEVNFASFFAGLGLNAGALAGAPEKSA